MKKLYVVLVLGLAVGVVCWAFGPSIINANGKEAKVKVEELPDAVKATLNGFIEKEAPGAKIEEIEKEVEDGKVIYDIELEVDDKDIELEIAEDGTLLKKEAEEEKEEKEGEERDEEDKDDGVTVALEDLPSVVKATVEAQGGEIGEIEKEEEDGEVVYDVDVKIDGKKFELKIAANGTLLKKNTDEDKDGDEEDDDNDGDEE